jgi:hypothetical protein
MFITVILAKRTKNVDQTRSLRRSAQVRVYIRSHGMGFGDESFLACAGRGSRSPTPGQAFFRKDHPRPG